MFLWKRKILFIKIIKITNCIVKREQQIIVIQFSDIYSLKDMVYLLQKTHPAVIQLICNIRDTQNRTAVGDYSISTFKNFLNNALRTWHLEIPLSRQ